MMTEVPSGSLFQIKIDRLELKQKYFSSQYQLIYSILYICSLCNICHLQKILKNNSKTANCQTSNVTKPLYGRLLDVFHENFWDHFLRNSFTSGNFSFQLLMKKHKWFNYYLHLEREYFKLYLYGFHIFSMIYYV